jgi:hypothetical protein
VARCTTPIIRSQGEPTKRGYAVADLPASRSASSPPVARVVLVDPRRTVTRTGAAVASRPSNLPAGVWPPPKPPAIEFPEKLPGNCRQPIIIRDPDVLATWERGAAETQGRADQ